MKTSRRRRRLLVVCVAFAAVVADVEAGEDTTVRGSGDNGRPPTQQSATKDDDRNGDAAGCRVAVCLSGAVRSFVHPAVHMSIRRNLIEAIEADGCEVDVFAYATRQDTVDPFKQNVNTEFTPGSSDIDVALAVLKPTKVVWHQQQTGIIPNSCGALSPASTEERRPANTSAASPLRSSRGHGADSASSQARTRNLYWQLYKSLAAYRMALREEKRKGGGYVYDWIVRGRFDVAWIRPLPPLRSFSAEAAWFGRRYWPMSDHFALVPRSFSDSYFTAIRAFYTCDKQSWPPSRRWWQPECSQGFEESLLFRYLHAAEVPYRFYPMFEYVITRGELGGVCESGTAGYFDVCNLMKIGKGFQAPFTSQDCVEALTRWIELRCQALLPAEGMSDAGRINAILTPDRRAWEELIVTPSTTLTSMAEGEAVEKAAGTTEAVRRAAIATVTRTGNVFGHDAAVIGAVNGAAATAASTAVPKPEDLDLARSELLALREALVPLERDEDDGYGFDSYEGIKFSRPERWGGWEYFPHWWSYSTRRCPLEKPSPGRTPHLVMYYTLDASLLLVVEQAFKCFLDALLFEDTQEDLGGFDRSLCERTSPLETVMISVGLHTEELGICTVDGSVGVDEAGRLVFDEPAAHCVGYGRLGDDKGDSR